MTDAACPDAIGRCQFNVVRQKQFKPTWPEPGEIDFIITTEPEEENPIFFDGRGPTDAYWRLVTVHRPASPEPTPGAEYRGIVGITSTREEVRPVTNTLDAGA